MDWQAVENGLRDWVATMTGIDVTRVAWDFTAVGFRAYPQVDLRLFDHRARDRMAAEVTYPEPADPADPLQPVATAQRACSWSITVTTRDQRADQRAYVVLDALAVMLELPYTLHHFSALGVSVLDAGRVITRADPPDEHRDLSQATLTLELGYVAEVTVPPGVADGGVDVIEHVEVGGTAMDATTPIPIAPEIIPPLP